jgi:hypothetical protein
VSDESATRKRRTPRRSGPVESSTTNGNVRASRADADLERRRALGQFFTPPDIARFMWDAVERLNGRPLPAGARVVDPACGEGVFLRAATERGRGWELFGADIDETLVPGWRRDPALQAAHLQQVNGLVDDPAAGLCANSFDVVIGNPPFGGTGLKDLLRLLRSSPRVVQPDLFDDPIDQPAATGSQLGPWERQALDRLARALAGYVCWRLNRPRAESDDPDVGPDQPALFAGKPAKPDAAASSAGDRQAQAILDWPADRPLDGRRPDIRTALQRMAATAVEVYFVERFVRLAKPGGWIAMIVPESILSSDQLSPLRQWVLTQARMYAVIGLPQKVFTGVGANARTGIVFLRRLTAAESRPGARRRRHNVLMGNPHDDRPGYLSDYLAGVLAELASLKSARK